MAALGIVGEVAASAGIMRGGTMRCTERGGDVGAGAETGVCQACHAQSIERGGIDCAALGLDQRDSGGDKPKPFEILENRVDELRPGAAPVEVFDADEEAQSGIARDHRRVGMTEVKPPGWRRREAGCRHRARHWARH